MRSHATIGNHMTTVSYWIINWIYWLIVYVTWQINAASWNMDGVCLQENCLVYSSYYSSLQGEDKYRYRMKIGLLGCGLGYPYLIELGSAPRQQDLCTLDWQEWPEVQYPDIYNYLVVTHSVYTQDMLRAYKSLDAYNLFVNGWVGNVRVLCLVCDQSIFLAFAEVRHSQSISKTPVNLGLLCAKTWLFFVHTVRAWQD